VEGQTRKTLGDSQGGGHRLEPREAQKKADKGERRWYVE